MEWHKDAQRVFEKSLNVAKQDLIVSPSDQNVFLLIEVSKLEPPDIFTSLDPQMFLYELHVCTCW